MGCEYFIVAKLEDLVNLYRLEPISRRSRSRPSMSKSFCASNMQLCHSARSASLYPGYPHCLVPWSANPNC